MKRIIRVLISVILAASLMMGTFSVGMAAEAGEPTEFTEVETALDMPAAGETEEAAEPDSGTEPAEDPVQGEQALEEIPSEVPEPAGDEPAENTDQPAESIPEPVTVLKKISLDLGREYSLFSDKEYLTEDITLKAVKWDDSTNAKYSSELEAIHKSEQDIYSASVKKADDSVYTSAEDIEVYITSKEWKTKSVKDLNGLGLKLYLSDENGKLKETKTEVKKTEEGITALSFKTKRIGDILITAAKDKEEEPEGETSKGTASVEDEAVDVSEHPLAETEASDSEPLLALKELSPKTKALLGTEGAAEEGENTGEEEEPSDETSVDGVTIEKISIKWLSKSTGETEPAGQGTLRLETDSAVIGNQQFQIDFAISGKDDHEPGTVEIVIPAYIWLDRYGEEPGNLTLSVPEEPGEGADFAWKRVGDNIVITNVRRLSAASKVMIQGTFRNVKPYNMVDKDLASSSDYSNADYKGVSKDLTATIGITTPNDNYISMTSNSINATIDTHVVAASATKSSYNTTRREYYVYHTTDLASSEGGIPAEFISQLDDPSKYSFVKWYVSGSATGSQPFKMVINDTYNGTVVHYLDAQHKESETLNVRGRVLGVQNAQVWNEAQGKYVTGNVASADGNTVSAVLFDGYDTLSHSAYVWTAYLQEDFPDSEDDYSVSNTQITEVTGWDDMITTSKEATASTPFRTPIIYTIKKVWNDGNNEKGHRPNSGQEKQSGQYFYINYTDDAGHHYGGHNLTDTEGWTYSWSDLGRDRKYSAYEDTGSYIFRDHIIDGSLNYGEDEAGKFVEYDVWWYDRENSEYDSDTHTWTTTNKYKERHVRLYEIPFVAPTAYAYMNKNTNSYTNSNRMSKNDRALNILRRGEDVIVSYYVNGNAQTMPYTLGSGNAGLITSYGQKEVTLELEDNYKEDVFGSAKNNSLLFDDTIKLTTDDAEIAYVTLNSPSFEQWGQYGTAGDVPVGELPPGYQAYYGWSFRSITGELTDPPVERLLGLKNGEWIEFATVKGGKVTVNASSGATLSGRQVNLPAGVERVKTVLTVPTVDPADAASWKQRIDKAGMSYNVGVRLLGNSQTLKNRLAAVFEQNDYGMCTLDNFATLNITGERVNPSRSVTDWSRAWLHGRNHRVAVRSDKSFAVVENDLVGRKLKLHSTINMVQQSNVLERNEYDDARAEGLIPKTESGTWYDLLPLGVMPDTDSVKLTNGDKKKDVYIVPNYKESGRILLVVKAEVVPHISYQNVNDPNPYKNDDTYPKEGYKDVHTLEFDSYYSWDEARLYGLGSTVRNVAAYEADEDALGNINGWAGEPDDPQRNHNQRAMDAVGNDKDIMTGLDPDRQGDHTAFVYSGSVLKSEEIDFMAATELRKYVTRDGLGMWSTGRDGSAQVTVTEGGYYTYMLYVYSDGETTTKNMIFLDTLENHVPGSADGIDYGHGSWKGDFVSVDTSEFEALGIAPVIYYNTSEPDLAELKNKGKSGSSSTEIADADYIYNYIKDPANGWTTVCPSDKSTIKAIAIDIRKKTDGTDFELAPEESIFCTVRMKSKVYDTVGQDTDPFNADENLRKQAANNDYAYNGLFLGCTQVDPIGQETHAVINHNYTRVGIVPFEFKVKKVWDDANNSDGKRPTGLTVHLLANGKRMMPDRTITLDDSNGWSGKFDHVIQYDENGNWINYSFEEEPAEGTAYTLEGYTMGTERDGENVTLTNSYTPEKTKVTFEKEWTCEPGQEDEMAQYKPESVTVRLMADGAFTGKQVVVKPDRNGVWSGSFTDLPKYSNPSGLSGNQQEIKYSVEEVPVYRFEDSYETDEAGKTKITNKYWPFGYLQIKKAATGTTDVSKEKEFTFTLLLSDPEGNELTEKYNYTKFDASGNELETGTIGNGDKFSIRDGYTFKVDDIPSESRYEVIESELSGFTLVGSSGTSGSIRAGEKNIVTASFTNKYEAEGGQTISLNKTLEGRTMSRYQFRFELVDNTEGSDKKGDVIATASADQNGDAVFSRLNYTAADHGKTFEYIIREVDREKPGYTYDKNTFTVKVAVTDKGDGKMECVPTYYKADGTEITAADVTFNNIYHAKGDITLKAWKQLPAGTLQDGQFSFELLKVNTDETSEDYGSSSPVQTKTNDEKGTITFDALNFTEADAGKSYFYVLREVKGSDETVIYDDTVKGIELSVVDNGDGTLAVTQTNVSVTVEDGKYIKGAETDKLPVFVNELQPGDISLTKQTTWDGQTEPKGDMEFPFTLTLVGETLPETIKVQLSDGLNKKAYSEGNAPTPLTDAEKQEKEVTLEEGGIYRFNLKAGQKLTVKDLPAGVAYQFQEDIPTGWTLTFENVAGTVVPKATQDAVYTNKYEPGKAVATVLATKRMDGKAPEANKFAFQLIDDNKGTPEYGKVLQELPNHASGFVLFDLEYEVPGEYHYIMREVQKPIASVENGKITYSDNEDELRKIQFDENEYGVTVTVTRNVVDGAVTLSAKTTYDDGQAPQFINSTRPGSLQIRKAADGLTDANKDAVFTFKVTLSNDAGMPLTGEGGMVYYTENSEEKSEVEPTPSEPSDPEDAKPADQSGTNPPANSDKSSQKSRKLVLKDLNVNRVLKAAGDIDYGKVLQTGTFGGSGMVVNGVKQGSVKYTVYDSGYTIMEPTNGVSGSFNSSGINSIDGRAHESKYFIVKGTCYANGNIGHLFCHGNSQLLYADLRGIDVSHATDYHWFIDNTHKLEYLDISTWNLPTHTYRFLWSSNLKVVKLGPDFYATDNSFFGYAGGNFICVEKPELGQRTLASFCNGQRLGEKYAGTWVRTDYKADFKIAFNPNGATGSMDPITVKMSDDSTRQLPKCTFESDLNFAGWSTDPDAILPEYGDEAKFTGAALGGQTITLYAIWMSEDSFLLNYDANGGFSKVQWQRVNGPADTVNMPVPTHPNNYEFLYWTTNADGSGDRFSGQVSGADFNAQPGATVKLYAQYLDPSQRAKVKVEHYQQNADLNGYSLYATDQLGAFNIGDSVTPEKHDYTGFIAPSSFRVYAGTSTEYTEQSDGTDVTVVKGGITVRYYYDRTRYTLAFNANEGTGTMSDIEMIGGVAAKLPVNRFARENYLFVGWNTAPDGSGTSYGDGQSVNSIGGNGETVTLYAQWFDLGDASTAEPTNGEYIVTCKANETIVFPQLPSGTHYTVTEVQLPDGWSQKSIDQGSGTVLSAERVNVTATNQYSATGKADIVAYKALPGETMTAGQFTFQLLDESGSLVQSKSNGAPDNMEETLDAEGNPVPNPHYGMSYVYFDTISYDKQGVYKYTIKEVRGDDSSVKYDDHTEHVTVYVTDRGDGRLVTRVMYDESGANFRNDMNPGDLKVSKTIKNATAAAAESKFFFTVYLFDSAGNEIKTEYDVDISDGTTAKIKSGGAVGIKGGQSFTVKGLPNRSTYTVVERPAAGFEQTGSENTEGTVIAGTTAEASFENAYTSRTSESDGGAVIEAKKVFENADIEEEQFSFRLLNSENEEIETVYAETDGTIRFSPLHFGLDDDGQRYVYYIEEIPGREEKVTYDTHRERVAVEVSDNGDGTMTAEVIYAAGEIPVFTNVYEPDKVSVSGKKTWDDDNNRDGKRPSSIMVRLLADGEEIAMKTVTAKDSWKYSFSDLLKYDPEGNEIKYTVAEDNVKDYSVRYNGYDIINSYTPGKVNVPVTKIWKDSNDAQGIRPSSITVKLYANGTDTGKTLTLTEENNWSGNFTGLNENQDGKKIDYVVREVSVQGYTSEMSGNASSGYNIVNTVMESDTDPLEPPQDEPSDGQRRFRPSGRRGKLRRARAGYEIIEDSDIPLAKLPTGEGYDMLSLTVVTAAAAAAILIAALAGRRRKKED